MNSRKKFSGGERKKIIISRTISIRIRRDTSIGRVRVDKDNRLIGRSRRGIRNTRRKGIRVSEVGNG